MFPRAACGEHRTFVLIHDSRRPGLSKWHLPCRCQRRWDVTTEWEDWHVATSRWSAAGNDLATMAERSTREVITSMAGAAAVPREDQIAAVRALVESSSRVLVVQATGWGKSAVYWAATKALRQLGRGNTLVVSHLLVQMEVPVFRMEEA